MIPKLDDYKRKWNVESDLSIKPGLEAIKAALKVLQNPQERLQVVHLAGTNGKGSTLTFIEHIAKKHGLTVGKFMSPCIVDVHDQIQINGESISQKEMDEIFQQLEQSGLSGKLTDFELLTCIAFLYFAKKKVDLVLLETGMGGREDSTNVVTPILSIITSIALDHTKFLGPTIQSIAKHKAGIIKRYRPVIIGRLPEEALIIVKNEAKSKSAPVLALGEHIDVITVESEDVYRHNGKGLEIPHLTRLLPGKHQAENMALAITAFLEIAQHLQVPFEIEKIHQGVKSAQLPGRFEEALPNIYFDGAHNPASAKALAQTIQTQFPNEPIRFVIGMLADKDVESVLRLLEQVSGEFYFVDFPNERAMKAKELYTRSNATKKAILSDPVSFIQNATNEPIKTFVTGSLYLLGIIREKLMK